jgi:uncharacterized protein YbbC (DUF1343 family)
MRSVAQALLYPGIGLLETTNISVGRGTDTPFEVIGAPWLDSRFFSRRLNRLDMPGVCFVPVSFTPTDRIFAGRKCNGVNIIIKDRSIFDPIRTGLEIAHVLYTLYPENWDFKAFDLLLRNEKTFTAFIDGKTATELISIYQPELKEFLKRRSQFLLYR